MGNSNIFSKIIYTYSPEKELPVWINKYPPGKVFVATEENVNHLWTNRFEHLFESFGIKKVVVPSGEDNKKLSSVEKIWEFLSRNGADRKSLLINIGGGMLTDLAGFAASTFKRGHDFLNIPTTLLSQVDASVGGKTGINFLSLKNEIGTFQEPIAVIISSEFLRTLDHGNFISGFAEMIKHGLINSPEHLSELARFDFNKIDYQELQKIIRHSVEIKSFFVRNDPTEKNIRKALNFGHTAGHAFESLSLVRNRPLLHGYAVSYGMITEGYLSVIKCGFNKKDCDRLTGWLLDIYGKFNIDPKDFEWLYERMTHDKKNEGGRINFTLLSGTGDYKINQHCEKALIFEALGYFNEQQKNSSFQNHF